MAEYRQPRPGNYNILGKTVVSLTNPFGGSGGEEGALLNGLLALGYDPALVRSFADADPNRRFLDDAVTRALRAGVSKEDINRALTATRAAATGDSEGALKALGVNPDDLPPESRSAYDAIAQKRPLPFLDRGQVGAPGALSSGSPAAGSFGEPNPPEKQPYVHRGDIKLNKPSDTSGTSGLSVQQQIDNAIATDRAKNAPKKPVGPQEQEAWVRKHFGADAWFLDVPEVRKILFDMAATGSTDGEEAARQVSATDWYRNTAATARNWVAQKKKDPASIISDITEQAAYLNEVALGMGMEIEDGRLRAIAESSLRFGWSPTQIKSALGAEFEYDAKAQMQATKVTEMKAMAQKYLVPLADETIASWGKALMMGTQTDEQFQEYVKNMSKSLFPQLNAAIDAGHTVEDYMNPYKQIAAQTLEAPVASINFMDPKWRKALDQVDPKTGMHTVMSLSDWTAHLKTDKSYGYDKTQQGIGEAANLATSILKKFGKMA